MEEEGLLGSIGFMFDAQHHKEEKRIILSNGIIINLKLIGDLPGHVQSGQYLWPAAEFAGNHLISHWDTLKASTVLELGAGCGLTGLIVSKLQGTTAVFFTDYDPGSVELIGENVTLNYSDNCQCFVDCLEWGKPIPLDISRIKEYPDNGFKLIIGADLLYCVEVVEPLFKTVMDTINAYSGVFVLTTSFSLEKIIDTEILRVCANLCLERQEVVSLDEDKGECRVEYYRLQQ